MATAAAAAAVASAAKSTTTMTTMMKIGPSSAAAAAAGSNAKKMITRWSLNSLARMKRDMVVQQDFDFDNETNNNHNVQQTSPRVVLPTARALVRDIALRLDAQKSHVERMERYVHQNLLLEGNHPENYTINGINNNSHKIITTSAFSQPAWWKQNQSHQNNQHHSIDYYQKRQLTLDKASQNLHNLKMLHENTHEIAQTLFAHLDTKQQQQQTSNEIAAATTTSVLDKKETKWIKAALRQVRDRHAMTVENLAEFVITTRPYWETPQSLDTTVMDFLRGRLGVQLLCEHYLSPYHHDSSNHTNNGGIVCVDCHLQTVLEDAISEARILCESNYSHLVTAAPEVVIVHKTLNRNDQFTIVRPWVHYVLVELLKNAMAVSMERMCREQQPNGNGNGNDENESSSNCLPPPIYISIDDHHDEQQQKGFVSIDVLDQGGGFQNPDLAHNTDILFDFVRTKKTMWDRLDDQQTYAMVRSPMQGLGVGLCLSRLMMQHFGGTVELQQHPPLSLRQKQALMVGDDNGNGGVGELQTGCVASIKLVKDLDHPEQLFENDHDHL